jgi:hypothetical protein
VVAWALWALAVVACLVIPWLDRLLRQAGRPDLAQWDARPVLGAVSAATVGAVLASRRPRHPVGWLLLAQTLSLLATGAAAQYLAWGLLAPGGALPATRAALAPLALVGQGHGGRTRGVAGGGDAGARAGTAQGPGPGAPAAA